MHWFVVTCSRLNPEHDCHWHNNCFKNRHDWATNCWKIGACSNVECDSSMCNWQVFLMNHHTIVLRANQASSSNPTKQIEWQTLKASLTFCFVAWWPWIFVTALPPPPKKKNNNKNKNSHLWAFTIHLSIWCLPSCWKHLKASRVSLVALSNYLKDLKRAFYSVLKLENLYVPFLYHVK